MSRAVTDAIIKLLIDRIPNFVAEATIRARLPNFLAEEVRAALGSLESSPDIEFRDDPRPLTGTSTRFYRWKKIAGMPVRETIRVADLELPRLFSDSAASLFPEVYNEALERLAEYTRTQEERYSKLVNRQERKYWANVVGLFGVFVSVLSLIIVGLPKITTDPSLPFWSVVGLNLAQLLPVAVLLMIFVLIARWVVR